MCEMCDRAFPERRVHVPWPVSVFDRDADGGVVWMSRDALLLQHPSAVPDPKQRLGVGGYWTVFASELDDWSAVKIRIVKDEKDERAVREEERAYLTAAAHHVGPAVRAWFILPGNLQISHPTGGRLNPKCEERDVWAIAVAVVERFDESAEDGNLQRNAHYIEKLNELKARVDDMEQATGLINKEPFAPKNVLVEWKRPDCDEIIKIVVGDWGSYKMYRRKV